MLNLWATWCGPCRYEIPALIRLQEEFGDQGLQVVGVSMDRAGMEPQISSFARSAGINYKIVHDPRAKLADVFDTTIIPTTALIDRDGKIVWYHAGIVSDEDPELLEALEKVLSS
ncbi:MAG: TlpA disulfide reductase family protein, partial [Thermoanaerobaculia bacterium]|nr:TlpA disulfide reductase family protein [Thermoanaerobaculia bacterium]